MNTDSKSTMMEEVYYVAGLAIVFWNNAGNKLADDGTINYLKGARHG